MSDLQLGKAAESYKPDIESMLTAIELMLTANLVNTIVTVVCTMRRT